MITFDIEHNPIIGDETGILINRLDLCEDVLGCSLYIMKSSLKRSFFIEKGLIIYETTISSKRGKTLPNVSRNTWR